MKPIVLVIRNGSDKNGNAYTRRHKKENSDGVKDGSAGNEFEDDIVKEAVRLGLDPVRELKIAIKVLNDVKEDGEIEDHVAEILKELKAAENE